MKFLLMTAMLSASFCFGRDAIPVLAEVSQDQALALSGIGLLIILGFWLGLGWVCGSIASGKGHSFGGFFVLGLIAPLISLLVVLILPATERPLRRRLIRQRPVIQARSAERFDCPNCGESIPIAAKTCRFCQTVILPSDYNA